MHAINVLTFGSRNFNISLEELKDHLNFKLTLADKEISKETLKNYDVLILHKDGLDEDSLEKLLKNSEKIKILVSSNNEKKKDHFNCIFGRFSPIKELFFLIVHPPPPAGGQGSVGRDRDD